MDYSHVRDIAISICYIWKHIKTKIIGVLILHGTDTMTYSAAALSLMMGQGLPFSIVYTGAQKPIQMPASDAPSNLQNALYTLQSLNNQNMAEVVIVMGDRAILGTSSEKINGSHANAFDAPLHKYVTRFDRLDYPPILAPWLQSKRKKKFDPTIWDGNYNHTLIVHSHLGLSPEIIKQHAQDPNIQAIILYSYGAGTACQKIIKSISEASSTQNKPAFVVSPVNTKIEPVYESTHLMIEKGITPLYMTLSAALAKLEIALRLHKESPQKIINFMTTNYVGEIPSAESGYFN